MCLDRITKVYKPVSKEVQWAYKVLRIQRCSYHHEYEVTAPWQRTDIELDEWIKANTKTRCYPTFIPDLGLDEVYESGFHMFKTRKDAEAYRKDNFPYQVGVKHVSVRVKIRGVRTLGIQDGYKVLVAREMYVPKSTIDRVMKPRKRKKVKK